MIVNSKDVFLFGSIADALLRGVISLIDLVSFRGYLWVQSRFTTPIKGLCYGLGKQMGGFGIFRTKSAIAFIKMGQGLLSKDASIVVKIYLY